MLDRDGEVVVIRGAMRDHPGLKHEMANRSFVSKALVRLGVSFETFKRPVGRPAVGGLGITHVDLMTSETDDE